MTTPLPSPSWPTRLRTRCRSDDRGGVLETVIVFPIVLLLFLGAIQGALYFHARNIAIKAGEEGLRQTRSQIGNSTIGTAAAYAYIAQTGSTVLKAPIVVANRTPRDASIQIAGQPITLIPFLELTITVNQNAPVERITTPGQAW